MTFLSSKNSDQNGVDVAIYFKHKEEYYKNTVLICADEAF